MNRSYRAALIGAFAGPVAIMAARAIEAQDSRPDSLAYWLGVMLGGALLGMLVGRFVKAR